MQGAGGRRARQLARKRRGGYRHEDERARHRHRSEERPHREASIPPAPSDHSSARRRRSALPMTDTELKLIAAAAIIGDSSRPNTGYSTPAAIGTPAAL